MATVGVGISAEQAASVSLGESTGALTADERQRVNRQVGASIDKKLGASMKAAFGLHLDASQLIALTGATKAAVRSKLSTSLGITKETGAGAGGTVSFGGAAGVGGTQASLGTILGLKAGGTTTAGGSGTPLAGVTLAAGVDPKGIPGLTAGITVLDPEAVQIRVSASRDVQAELDELLTDSLERSGLSPQKQEAVKSEIKPQLNKALEETFRSSFGPAPEFPHAMGVRLLDATVRMPRRGEWTALVTIDQLELDAQPPTGPFWFEIEKIEFRCSVVPGRSGRSQGGRTSLRVVGGAGGLSHDLDVRNYGATTVKTVVDDILRDAGETLSAEADTAVLEKRLDSWQRVKGQGRDALSLLTTFLRIGATWRILRDGTVWIGVDAWPEVEPDGTVQDDDWGDGSILLAPDTPTMVPGVVVRGQRVEEVLHHLDQSGLRTELRSVGVRSAVERSLDPIRHETEYHKRYACKVVRQNGDKTVDVIVDDDRMRGRGVAKCRIRAGLPGCDITAKSGARCMVGWENGDPAFPYVSDWEMDADFVQIKLARGTRPAAGAGSMVRVIIPGTPVMASAVPFPIFGFVEIGNDDLLV
jgi:hypothetical protein